MLIRYIDEKYGDSRAVLRIRNEGESSEKIGGQKKNSVPVYYVYDSYHIDIKEWERLLTDTGDISVRGGNLDGVFIGLWLNEQDRTMLKNFDGFVATTKPNLKPETNINLRHI